MDETEKAELKTAMGEEASTEEPKVEVGVDGTVKVEDKQVTEQFTMEQLKERNELLEEFAAGVVSYMKPVNDDDPNGELTLDLDKVVKEDGRYKLIPIDKVEEEPVKEEKVVDDNKVDEFTKDPKAFLKDLREELKQEIKEDMQKELEPIKKSNREAKVKTMLTQVRTAHPDFDNYQEQIATLSKDLNIRIDSAKRLEALYVMAKNQEGSSPTSANPAKTVSGTVNSTRTSSGTPDEADEIFSRMQNAGIKPDKDIDLTDLLGTDRLGPI